MTLLIYRMLVILLALSIPVWAVTSEQVMLTAVQSGPMQNKALDSTNTLTSVTIAGTIPGSATYTAPTLTSPTISGTIGGSATWPAPGTIGGTTPAAISGTTITATTSIVNGTCKLLTGAGTPEGAQTAPVCSRYLRTDGSTGTTLYIKESGSGNTGWVAVSPSSVTWATPGTIGSGTPNTGAFTTLSATGQITSTLTTGTAPFAITSTTKSTNLNADFLDGFDWNAPGAIGGTTPAAGSFTTLAASTSVAVGTPTIKSGAGSPEGVVTATVGSLFFRTDGSAGTVLYSKEAGSGNAGWVAVSPGTVNWASPGLIGSTTPAASNFTSVLAQRFIGTLATPTYGATVTIDGNGGALHIITATNNTNFVISNPSASFAGQQLMIQVKNTSGGALGTITWDTQYKMASFTKPANGTRRTVTFIYDGTNWVEVNCSPEVPN